MNPLRLTILTQYFPPEMGAPQARLSELGERLIDCGWDVTALTALPNYPEGRVRPEYRPWKAVIERVGRITTARVPLVPSQRGFARRLGAYFSFAASAVLLGPRLLPRPDLLFVESPPLFIGLAAVPLASRWKVPYVFNVSDLWPESAIRMGVVKEGALTRMAASLERSLYRRAAAVTGQSDEIIDGVLRVAPGVRTQVVTNGVDPRRFGRDKADAEARAMLGSGDGPVFLYAGLLGLAQGLDQILDASAALPRDVPARFVLVGAGPDAERLAARVAREKLDRVTILPPVARERVPALLAASDVAFVTLGMSLPGAVPSKIYEAMASELPILLVAGGEAARRVTDAGAGYAVGPGDGPAILSAVRRLAADAPERARLGKAGRRAAEELYDRDRIAERLDVFLRQTLSP